MTRRLSLFTLISYCAIVFSFALIFAYGWFTACDGFYGASACWLSHMKQKNITIPGLVLCTAKHPKSIHQASLCPLSSRRRLMRVNDLFGMELMAERLGKWPAFLVQEIPCSPSSSTILPQQISVPSKILPLVQRAISIRAHHG